MQTSTRPRDHGASFAARKGHVPQLSISDESHHVTEAIGYMYEDDPDQDGRRLSSPLSNHRTSLRSRSALDNAPTEDKFGQRRTSIPRKQLPERKMSGGNVIITRRGEPRSPVERIDPWSLQNGSASPPLGVGDLSPSDTATSQFPLNDIDYESSPAAVAQELSNLQALRRMSMDVGATGDPDLPQLNPAGMPSAPSASSSEDDASRLFWVPARLHPELAPKEFKTFLESKAEQIKRRSGELSSFSSPSSSRSSSLSAPDSGGLRRKKSMLSRQINSSIGYEDGAERLERKRSQSRRTAPSDPNLQELESLVAANGEVLQRVSLEGSGGEDNADVILPSVPGSSLKRSTRTTYHRGGSIKGRGARGTYAQRAARRAAEGRAESPTFSSDAPSLPGFESTEISNLAKTLKDPSALPNAEPQLYSTAKGRNQSPSSNETRSAASTTFDSMLGKDETASRLSTSSMPEFRRQRGMGRSPPGSSAPFETQQSVPQIVEVPPPEESEDQQRPSSSPANVQPPLARHPERTSSREAQPKVLAQQRPGMPPKQHSSIGPVRTPLKASGMPPASKPTQTLEQPSPLPGNDTNTSNLSFIPTLTVDKRADHKTKEETKKSGWGWLLGKEDSTKEKPEKPKAKIQKPPQSHDNTRLDVLQTSIDGSGKGRESVVLDRESLKLEEERKKESHRKSAGSDTKKEKEGLFSSIFGVKKKAEKESSSRRYRDRVLSPEPPYRELKPDIDYNWTRFSILEERAIYRMAHIKLANPRRALYSQVLLSNFMYSYLAKVQQMHPQMNLPTSAKQQRKQQQKVEKQPDEFTQYQRYQQQQAQQQTHLQQQQQQQHHHHHRGTPQGAHQQYGDQQDYDGDTSVYDYDAGSQRPSSRGSKHSMESNASSHSGYNQYYHGKQQHQHHQYNSQAADDDDDDMW